MNASAIIFSGRICRSGRCLDRRASRSLSADHKEKPLIFAYEGRPIRAGYHVTEVKAGQFSALDCGANTEAWSEIFIQLWDIDEGDRTHMPAGKFSGDHPKSVGACFARSGAKLTFEVSDGERRRCSFTARPCRASRVTRSGSISHRAPRAASRAIGGSKSRNQQRVVRLRRLLLAAGRLRGQEARSRKALCRSLGFGRLTLSVRGRGHGDGASG